MPAVTAAVECRLALIDEVRGDLYDLGRRFAGVIDGQMTRRKAKVAYNHDTYMSMIE